VSAAIEPNVKPNVKPIVVLNGDQTASARDPCGLAGSVGQSCFNVHGTSIAIRLGGTGNWLAVLIRGASGAGKSDLALRCLAQPTTALLGNAEVRLVADDQTLVQLDGSNVFAEAPVAIAGLLEVRGLGLLAVPHVRRAQLLLVADLALTGEVPRYPEPQAVAFSLAGQLPRLELPHLLIAPFEPAGPLKLLLALLRTAHHGHPVGADAPKPHHLPEGQ
jgi:HPr kinase/phosphorylase